MHVQLRVHCSRDLPFPKQRAIYIQSGSTRQCENGQRKHLCSDPLIDFSCFLLMFISILYYFRFLVIGQPETILLFIFKSLDFVLFLR